MSDPLTMIAAALAEAFPKPKHRITYSPPWRVERMRDTLPGEYHIYSAEMRAFGRGDTLEECIEDMRANVAERDVRDQQQTAAADALAKWDALAAQHGWSGPDEAERALAGEEARDE